MAKKKIIKKIVGKGNKTKRPLTKQEVTKPTKHKTTKLPVKKLPTKKLVVKKEKKKEIVFNEIKLALAISKRMVEKLDVPKIEEVR